MLHAAPLLLHAPAAAWRVGGPPACCCCWGCRGRGWPVVGCGCGWAELAVQRRWRLHLLRPPCTAPPVPPHLYRSRQVRTVGVPHPQRRRAPEAGGPVGLSPPLLSILPPPSLLPILPLIPVVLLLLLPLLLLPSVLVLRLFCACCAPCLRAVVPALCAAACIGACTSRALCCRAMRLGEPVSQPSLAFLPALRCGAGRRAGRQGVCGLAGADCGVRGAPPPPPLPAAPGEARLTHRSPFYLFILSTRTTRLTT